VGLQGDFSGEAYRDRYNLSGASLTRPRVDKPVGNNRLKEEAKHCHGLNVNTPFYVLFYPLAA
jgi:hypothetical protein